MGIVEAPASDRPNFTAMATYALRVPGFTRICSSGLGEARGPLQARGLVLHRANKFHMIANSTTRIARRPIRFIPHHARLDTRTRDLPDRSFRTRRAPRPEMQRVSYVRCRRLLRRKERTWNKRRSGPPPFTAL
jgi:hypothetical protein